MLAARGRRKQMPQPGSLPTFFFSYARKDDEEKGARPIMRRFFDDLQNALEAVTPGLPVKVRLGTLDRRIENGRDWDDDLTHGLKTSKALVVIATPWYFERENCGKEIAVFARRMHPPAEVIDGNLRHATNILHIRWMDNSAYRVNGGEDDNAQVHPVLHKVEWTLPDVLPNISADAAKRRAYAVQRYHEYGMRRCVKPTREYYEDLLTAFREAIREMPELPPRRVFR
jgi:hypothetical protein